MIYSSRHRFSIPALLSLLVLAYSGWSSLHVDAASRLAIMAAVSATVETTPVPSAGDAADDVAIWIHPTQPAQSIIIATDKKGGLAVYDLNGTQLQYLAHGGMNNVDIRYNFPLGGQSVALVTASNRMMRSIDVYKVDPSTRTLSKVGSIATTLTDYAYGLCMYHSPSTKKYYAFINTYAGTIEQWELRDNGAGQVVGTRARKFSVKTIDGTQDTPTEGCVADDELSKLYVGAELEGIWKYNAEPQGGTTRTLVDATGTAGHLTSNVEGLTLYYTSTGTGYLLASSQGSNTFVVYRRESNNAYLKTFNIVAGNGIDDVQDTDGIDVTNFNLSSAFPQGLFIAQDGVNDVGNQNFKLVPWQSIATQGSPALAIDTRWDPRQVGATPTPSPTPQPPLTRWVFLPMVEAAP